MTSESPREGAAQHAAALRLPFVTLEHDAGNDALWNGLNIETLIRFSCVPHAMAGALSLIPI